MGDIIRFERCEEKDEKEKRGGPAITNARISLLDHSHENVVNAIISADRKAEKMLRSIPIIPDIEFSMTDDTVKKIAEGKTPPEEMFYEYEGGCDPEYFASMRMSPGADGSAGGCLVYRRYPGCQAEVADPGSGEWKLDEPAAAMFDIVRSGGVQADITKLLAKAAGVNPYQVNLDALKKTMSDNMAIIPLYEEVRDFTDIAFRYLSDAPAFCAVLKITGKDDDSGISVCADGGEFILVRTVHDGAASGTEHLIGSIGGIDEARMKCRFWFDRHRPDSPVYRFPLSVSAFAEIRAPYTWAEVMTDGGTRRLTEAEQKNLRDTERMLSVPSSAPEGE